MKVNSIRMFALVCLMAAPAFAQDDPEGDLEREGGAQLQDGLAERRPAEQPVLDDPDPALALKTDALKKTVEQTINTLQENVQKMHGVELELPKAVAKKFESLDKRLERITGELIKATDTFMDKRNTDLEAYRSAVAAGLGDAKDKAGKAVVKGRETYIKSLEKLQKSAEQLTKDAADLAARAAPPAVAPKAEPSDAAPAPKEPEEGAEGTPGEE